MRPRYLALYAPFPLTLLVGLYLDSISFSQHFFEGQWLSNLLVFSHFIWLYMRVSSVIKKLMLYGLIIALGGEVCFSLLLGMYHYRLENIPLYVPLGHSIIYASVYYLAKEPWIMQHQKRIFPWMVAIMIGYALAWLLWGHDLFGFLCSLGILFLFYKKEQTRAYFSWMFFVVVYLELLGTYFGCWQWPDTWFGAFSWMPSGNPPSGISLFYFAFDLGCLWLYKQRNPREWKRVKRS